MSSSQFGDRLKEQEVELEPWPQTPEKEPGISVSLWFRTVIMGIKPRRHISKGCWVLWRVLWLTWPKITQFLVDGSFTWNICWSPMRVLQLLLTKTEHSASHFSLRISSWCFFSNHHQRQEGAEKRNNCEFVRGISDSELVLLVGQCWISHVGSTYSQPWVHWRNPSTKWEVYAWLLGHFVTSYLSKINPLLTTSYQPLHVAV